MAVLMGLALTFTACKKDDSSEDNGSGNGTGSSIPMEQKATVIYFGGTWCPPCGAYGKPAKEAIKEQAPGKAVVISCQVNGGVADPMNNADANTMAGLFGVSAVPSLFIGGSDDVIQGIPSNSNMSTNAVSAVNTLAGKTPKTNFKVSVKEDDGLLAATIDGEFFEDQTGEYHLAAYLLEDKLNHTQASDASKEKNIHYNILRAKFGTVITGKSVKAAPKKGDKFTETAAFAILPTYKKENLTIAVVMWKKGTDGKFTLSNASYGKL